MPVSVLVVDDEPDLELLIRQKFRKQVRDGALAFSFAGDGVEALERLAADPAVDIVLTDLNMPRMDGLTLLDRVGALDRLLKVVVVSAYGDMGNIRAAMNRGAFDFINKPIDFADLELTLGKTHRELEDLRQALGFQQELSAIRRELEIATQIQLSALPSRFPAFPERTDFDLYATMIPAQEVGGDFYDFFLLDEFRLGFCIGDVAGKGIGAALFMAVTRTLLRATALGGLRVDECLRHVNRVLFPETLPRLFVTLVYGILDTQTGAVQYAVAGHLPPLHVSGGAVTPLARTHGIGLCLRPDFAYDARTVTLAPGDTLLLYTDGVTEAADHYRALFSNEGLRACLEAAPDENPGAIVGGVLRAIETFADGAPQADDITLLALRYHGPDGRA